MKVCALRLSSLCRLLVVPLEHPCCSYKALGDLDTLRRYCEGLPASPDGQCTHHTHSVGLCKRANIQNHQQLGRLLDSVDNPCTLQRHWRITMHMDIVSPATTLERIYKYANICGLRVEPYVTGQQHGKFNRILGPQNTMINLKFFVEHPYRVQRMLGTSRCRWYIVVPALDTEH